jgi:orotidine-5'-phosphate decarboxylase
MKTFNERILGSARARRSRVVLALDFSGPFDTRLGKAERVLEEVKDNIAAVKVNHHLLLPYGLEGLKDIVRKCTQNGLPLIADLKINDIESTNINVADSLLWYGFDALIANPFVGLREGLGGTISSLHEKGGGIIFLVYMSHRGASEGYGLMTNDGRPLYMLFAERAKNWGADGVVVSAKSRKILQTTRAIVGKDCLIFAPGVGAQGGTPKTAEGADFIIVGRAITEDKYPSKALRALN